MNNLLSVSFLARDIHLFVYPFVFLTVIAFIFLIFNYPVRAVFLGLTLFFFILIILSSPILEWDARSIWFFHAKQIWHENSLYAYLHGYAAWSHNDYPPLIPALAASLALDVGFWNEVFPRLSVLQALLPVLLVFSMLFVTDKFFVLWLSGLLMLYCGPHGILSGYMDVILAIYTSAALILLVFLKSKENHPDFLKLIVLFFLFSTIPFIKNEGVVALLIISVIAIKILWSKPFALIFVSLSWMPWILLWKVPLLLSGIQNDLFATGYIDKLMVGLKNLHNVQIIFSHIFNELGLFMLLVSGFALLKPRLKFLWMSCSFFLIIYLSIIILIYLITPYDLTWHLQNSASRTFGVIGFMIYCCSLFEFEKRHVQFDSLRASLS